MIGTANGLDHDSVVSLDDIQTIPARHLGRHVGQLPRRGRHDDLVPDPTTEVPRTPGVRPRAKIEAPSW